MKKIHAGILLLIGILLVYLGDMLMSDDPVISGASDIIGTGINLFGAFLILYAIYRGGRWLWKKASKNKPVSSVPPKQP